MPDTPPSAAEILRSFLAARRQVVSTRTFARDQRVVGRLLDSIEAYAPSFLDDEDASRLARARSDGLTASDVLDARAIVDGVQDFLGVWMPVRLGASPGQLDAARVVLRHLHAWMCRQKLIDLGAVVRLFSHIELSPHVRP